eukprot:568088-Pyramimonas_sp.AAC.1
MQVNSSPGGVGLCLAVFSAPLPHGRPRGTGAATGESRSAQPARAPSPPAGTDPSAAPANHGPPNHVLRSRWSDQSRPLVPAVRPITAQILGGELNSPV